MLPRSLYIPSVIQEALGVVSHTVADLKSSGQATIPENAGIQLLSHTSDIVEDLYNRSMLNEKKMHDCDMMMAQSYANLEEKKIMFTRLNEAISAMPDIETQLVKSKMLLSKVEEQLHETEMAMIIMEDTKNLLEAKRKKAEEDYERDLQVKLERQKIFEEQFKSDVETFKRSGNIQPAVVKTVMSNEDLSEINLDQTEDDIEAFKDFLESSGELSDTKSQELTFGQ